MGGATTMHVSMFLSFKSCTFISTFQQSSKFLLEDTTSKEAFTITLTKLATGSTCTSLVKVVGATTDTFISRVYSSTLQLLDNKAN